MEDLELSVDNELFRISERRQPNEMMSYDFAWLNGPNDGTYGFTVGIVAAGSDATGSDAVARMSRERLVDEAWGFVKAFYQPGGIGEQDFPGHVSAQHRESSDQ